MKSSREDGHRISETSSRKQLKKMTQKKNFQELRTVSVDGFMTYGEWENGQRFADFGSCEEVRMEPFCMNARVQVMRDGNMYVSQLPKRKRHKPVLKLPHGSLSFGEDGMDRFIFVLPSEQREEFVKLLGKEAQEAISYLIDNWYY